MAVSILALVVALTGTSYAAGLIGSADVRNDSLHSRDIKDGTIKGHDIKNNVIGSNKMRNGSLKERDFMPGVLTQGDTRWALIGGNGAIVAQSGGFEVAAAYPVLPNTAAVGAPDNSLRANGNVYIDTNENLDNNGIVATIALQNTADVNGDGVTTGRAPAADANPEFSGEISVSQCGIASTTCAPPGTNLPEYLVVSPRNSDGTVTSSTQRKRFYVVITGDSDDRS
jgi:hypothetical protein